MTMLRCLLYSVAILVTINVVAAEDASKQNEHDHGQRQSGLNFLQGFPTFPSFEAFQNIFKEFNPFAQFLGGSGSTDANNGDTSTSSRRRRSPEGPPYSTFNLQGGYPGFQFSIPNFQASSPGSPGLQSLPGSENIRPSSNSQGFGNFPKFPQSLPGSQGTGSFSGFQGLGSLFGFPGFGSRPGAQGFGFIPGFQGLGSFPELQTFSPFLGGSRPTGIAGSLTPSNPGSNSDLVSTSNTDTSSSNSDPASNSTSNNISDDGSNNNENSEALTRKKRSPDNLPIFPSFNSFPGFQDISREESIKFDTRDDEPSDESDHQNRLFFSSLFTTRFVACNYTTQPGRSCTGCNTALSCYPSNVGRQQTCVGLFRYCNNGRCSLFQGSACNTSGDSTSTTSSSSTTTDSSSTTTTTPASSTTTTTTTSSTTPSTTA